jgi:CHAT domain-containing protein
LQKAGRIEKALDYYNKALEIYNQYSMPDMALPILNNLGTTLFDMKDYVKAEDYHRKGLRLSREINEKDQEVNFLLNLANDQIMLDSLNIARSNYESAYEIARSFNSPELIWKIFAGMAETYERKGEYEKVIQLNDSALKIIGNMRNNLQSSELKASYLASERYAYEDIINMLEMFYEKDNTKGYDTLAFRYAEQCKSRVLLDLLAESMAKNDKNKNEGTRYNNFQNTRPVSLDEAQSVCPDKNTVILEYMVGDSSSCLWLITRSFHKLFKITGLKTLQEQIEAIRFALLDSRQGISDFFTNAGNALYEELIRPAEPFLSKKSKLVIIPDGVLNYLPFEVLLTENKEPNKGTSDNNIPFLVKKYPISYGQSISVLRTLISKTPGEKNSGKNSSNLLAFGDPLYEDTSFNLQVKYPRLEFSGREIENIASFFQGGTPVIYLRNNATEENLKRNNELNKFNYIHFAVHGLINEDKPDLSSLVLTSRRNSGEDGLLQATEIFKLKLNPELVVLSACQTGLGKLVRGEGIVGLTRAFMYAGTPSVMVSLWSVSDLSTSVLMGEFYKNLIKNKLSKTDALRKAQLTLMSNEKYAHPFYWAPFILIGDWR